MGHRLNLLLFSCIGTPLVPMVAQAQMPSVLQVTTTQIAAAYQHTCALNAAGGVQCWGYNGFGQLGDGTTTDSASPVAVTELASGVAAVAVGGDHTCALTTAGAVQCWGHNDYGELGNGTTMDSATPVAVTGLSNSVAAITAGGKHTCALTTAGGVQCWGYNSNGQLGDGTTTVRDTPIAVSGLSSGVVAIASGKENHTCALTTAGAVLCWGYNGDGELGNGTTTDSAAPMAVIGLSSGVTAITAGGYHTCALTMAGAVECWGYNFYGQLGDGTTTNSVIPATVMNLPSDVTAIATGEVHTCALTAAGGVECWGFNAFGGLGDGTTTNSTTPVAVTGLSIGVAAITAGSDHSCALTTVGGVQCWGYNSNGQLGDGATTNSTTPVAVKNLASGVPVVATGDEHTCALTTAGGLQCWGLNNYGQLGNGTTTNSATPVAVTGLSSSATVITAGYHHTCALSIAGGVQCWGSNNHGQLGNGASTDSHTPVAVTGLSGGVVAIAAGDEHACALTMAGAVQCWGLNNHGQLGNGTTTDSNTPVGVTGLTNGVSAIAAHFDQTCALTTTGGVQCWGYNAFGQLGNGTTTDSATPVSVTNLTSGVAAIAVGGIHTCALTTTSGMKCWGNNGYGQLGNGTTTDSHTPMGVTNLTSGVAVIAAGNYHTCAITTTGGVQCWGSNGFGGLGNGTTTDSHVPVMVTGLSSSIAAITAGDSYTCARTTAFGVRCWGFNGYGQLGNSAVTDELVPVAILAGQIITFAPSQRMGVGNSVTLYAMASGGRAVSFDIWTPDTCTISGNKLDLISPGLCGVRVSQAGGSDGIGGTLAAAPQQLRLIHVEADLNFTNSFDAYGGFSQ